MENQHQEQKKIVQIFTHVYNIFYNYEKKIRYFEETCVIGVTFALILNFLHNFFLYSHQNSIDIEVRICLEKNRTNQTEPTM